MKKKNGFTLVELLAVIVVLAIIMIIAIPSVLDVMNNARKSSFVLYVDKVVTAVQTQYTYDANGGAIAGAGYYVYDITKDLNLTTTGSYKGYVIVNAMDVDNVEYWVSLYDSNYQILTYNIAWGMPTVNTKELVPYKSQQADGKTIEITNSYDACQNVAQGADCYTRNGYLIQNAGSSSEPQ